MRLISTSLSMALLIGCLVAAAAVAGEQEGAVVLCGGPYANRMPTPEELKTVLRNHQAWLEAAGEPDDKRRANLCKANLQGVNLYGANLEGANLQEALLWNANLQKANLCYTNLQKAYLAGVNLQKASLWGANLQGASLLGANLQGVRLLGANLQGAYLLGANLYEVNLEEANLQGAVYEPNPEKLPSFWTLTDPRNHLETLVFSDSPAGFIALREAFKKAGMRTQERQLTYAIEVE